MYEVHSDPRLEADPTVVPRIVTLAEAGRLGYSRHAVAHRVALGRWHRVLPRTYLTTDTFTWLDHLRAALAYAGPSALLTGAAALTGELKCVRRPSGVLVLAPRTASLRTRDWLRVRWTQRMPEPWLTPGPRRADLARAIADYAVEQPRLDDVRAVVAEAVRRELCTIGELRTELDAGPRRGSAHLRTAIADMSAGAWSAPEARAARLLRRAGLTPFEQNARIRLPSGRELIVDFLWRELRAVLEIDSIEHHFAPADLDATMDRHLALETLGYSVIHRSPRTVMVDSSGFVGDVAAWLRSRARLAQ